MSLWLEQAYHWAPTSLRDTIEREGLVPNSPSRGDGEPVRIPYICCSATPARALSLLPDYDDPDGEQLWDLWQVHTAKTDRIDIRMMGAELAEIRFRAPVPPDRVQYLATREVSARNVVD